MNREAVKAGEQGIFKRSVGIGTMEKKLKTTILDQCWGSFMFLGDMGFLVFM